MRSPQSQIPGLLLMFNINSLGIRRRTLANAVSGRLMSTLDDDNATARQKLQAKKTQIALNSSKAFRRIVPLATKTLRKDETMSMRQNMRQIISRTTGRPVPVSTRLPSALQLKSMKYRAPACRWHLGLFPIHYRYLSNGLEKFEGMQQWFTKPEEAWNCYPSQSPHLVDGIRTLIVPCAQWQQQLPLVECPLSALLRAFCSSDTRHYS